MGNLVWKPSWFMECAQGTGCPKAVLAATREQAITATKIASSPASQAGALGPACRASRNTTHSWRSALAGLTSLQPHAEGKPALEMPFQFCLGSDWLLDSDLRACEVSPKNSDPLSDSVLRKKS